MLRVTQSFHKCSAPAPQILPYITSASITVLPSLWYLYQRSALLTRPPPLHGSDRSRTVLNTAASLYCISSPEKSLHKVPAGNHHFHNPLLLFHKSEVPSVSPDGCLPSQIPVYPDMQSHITGIPTSDSKDRLCHHASWRKAVHNADTLPPDPDYLPPHRNVLPLHKAPPGNFPAMLPLLKRCVNTHCPPA